MRYWNEESPTLSHSTTKASTNSGPLQKDLSKGETMAPNITKQAPSELDFSRANYAEKNSDLTDSTANISIVAVPAPFDHAATKKLLRKLDLHLIPFLALVYL